MIRSIIEAHNRSLNPPPPPPPPSNVDGVNGSNGDEENDDELQLALALSLSISTNGGETKESNQHVNVGETKEPTGLEGNLLLASNLDAASVEMPKDLNHWICEQCESENRLEADECELCDSERPMIKDEVDDLNEFKTKTSINSTVLPLDHDAASVKINDEADDFNEFETKTSINSTILPLDLTFDETTTTIVPEYYSTQTFRYLPVEIWRYIFHILNPNPREYISIRSSLCRLFRDSLKPPPIWTEFPHPNYPTLKSLLSRLHKSWQKDSSKSPKWILIGEGVHNEHGETLMLVFPVELIGEGRDKTIIIGGVMILKPRSIGKACSNCDKPQSLERGKNSRDGLIWTTGKLRSCSCERVQYCSSKCQRAHWVPGGHKEEHKKFIGSSATSKRAIRITRGTKRTISSPIRVVRDLTLRGSKGSGVSTGSRKHPNLYFILKDLLIENCSDNGLWVNGAGTCINVEIKNCGKNGIALYRGRLNMTGNSFRHLLPPSFVGNKTSIHHNCTNEKSYHYGLFVSRNAKISFDGIVMNQRMAEFHDQILFQNGGGGNCLFRAEPEDDNDDDANEVVAAVDVVDEENTTGGETKESNQNVNVGETKEPKDLNHWICENCESENILEADACVLCNSERPMIKDEVDEL